MELLHVQDLFISYGWKPVLNGVNLALSESTRLGVIGESGSGKTTLARCLLGLLPSNARVSGVVKWKGQMLTGQDRQRVQSLRGKSIAYMVQHPHSGLDPMRRVGDEAVETIRVHDPELGRTEAVARFREVLSRFQFRDPDRVFRSYPFQLSGGMATRVYLAMCLALEPDLLIADEPTAGLDARTARQVLAELAEHLADRAMLLITHDAGVVRELTDSVAIVGAGRVLEVGDTKSIVDAPLHPYSRWLVGSGGSSVPGVGVPDREEAVKGLCPFRAGCPLRLPKCSVEPVPEVVVSGGMVRCHRYS